MQCKFKLPSLNDLFVGTLWALVQHMMGLNEEDNDVIKERVPSIPTPEKVAHSEQGWS